MYKIAKITKKNKKKILKIKILYSELISNKIPFFILKLHENPTNLIQSIIEWIDSIL